MNPAISAIVVLFVSVFLEVNSTGVYEGIYPPLANLSLLTSVQDCEPNVSENVTCPLFFGLLVAFGGSFPSSGCIPAIKIALDEINQDSSILPGYTLHYTLKDSECNSQVAESAFFSFILQPPVKLSILGSGCSIATEATAKLAYYFNLTQISYVSSSPILSNRQLFRTYFQMVGSEINYAYGYFEILKQFQWRKIALIVEQQNIFTLVMDLLIQQLRSDNISYTEVFFSSSAGVSDLGDRLFDPDSRIFLLSMYYNHALEVLCRASAEKIYYPRYQFILLGWYDMNWWVGSESEQKYLMEKYNCTVEDREHVLLYSISILNDEFISNLSKVVDSGITGAEFLEEYDQLLAKSPFGNTSIIYSPQCYDAMWTLARALNSSQTDLIHNKSLNDYLHQYNSQLPPEKSFGLQHFTYNNSAMLNINFQHLSDTNFIGLTGKIKFDEEGIKEVPVILIRQYRNSIYTGTLEQVLFALINISDPGNLTFDFVNNFNITNLWPNGLIPYDGTIQYEQTTLNIAITLVYSVLAFVGLILTFICIIFNCVFRKRKLMKLSSTNLNNIFAIGAVIFYSNIGIYVASPRDILSISVFCNLFPWLFSIGYSLFFGTIIMKMGRIYYIFNNALVTAPKKALHDWKLAIGVFILVFIDVSILVIYTVVNRNNLKATSVETRENLEDIGNNNPLGIMTQYYLYRCRSIGRDIVIYVLYGSKALLQVVTLILAISTRKVDIKGLDDSQYVILSVYFGSICLAIALVCIVTLDDYVNYQALVTCIVYIVATTTILLLTFVPKMVALYKDPYGTKIFMDPHSELRPTSQNDQNSRHNTTMRLSLASLNAESFERRSSNMLNHRSSANVQHLSSLSQLNDNFEHRNRISNH